MKITVTLDTDTFDLLQQIIYEQNISLDEAVKNAVRAGLRRDRMPQRPFKQKTVSLGIAKNIPWNKALAIAAALEDEELIRRMASEGKSPG